MKRPLLILLAMVFGLIAIAAIMMVIMVSQAKAQSVACAGSKELVARLAEKFHEHAIGGGLDGADRLISILVSDDKSTFTILITDPSGMGCIVATGHDWVSDTPAISGSKS